MSKLFCHYCGKVIKDDKDGNIHVWAIRDYLDKPFCNQKCFDRFMVNRESLKDEKKYYEYYKKLFEGKEGGK